MKELTMHIQTSSLLTLVLVFGIGGIVSGVSQPAEACSPAPCYKSALVPEDESSVALLSDQRLSFVWRVGALWTSPGSSRERMARPSDVTLTHLDDDRTIEVELQQANEDRDQLWLLQPKESLEPRSSYRLDVNLPCDRPPKDTLESTFQTTEQLSPSSPTASLEVGSIERQMIRLPSGASCSRSARVATASLNVQLGSQLQQWRDLLFYRTRLIKPSGETRDWTPVHSAISAPAPGASWEGRGTDMLYTSCEDEGQFADSGLEPGVSYEVYVEAQLPGTEITARTDTRQITLSCDDDGSPAGGSSGSSSDTGISSDGSSSDVHWNETEGASASEQTRRGCSCRSTAPSDFPPLSWLFVFAGLVWGGRRFDR